MTKMEKSASISKKKKFETLILIYVRLLVKYQEYILIQYRKNYLFQNLQLNGILKNFGTSARDIILSKILNQSIVHLTSFKEYNTFGGGILLSI